jgi:hypothetical protein
VLGLPLFTETTAPKPRSRRFARVLKLT